MDDLTTLGFDEWLATAKRKARVVYARCLHLGLNTSDQTAMVAVKAYRAYENGRVRLFQKRNKENPRIFDYIAEKI